MEGTLEAQPPWQKPVSGNVRGIIGHVLLGESGADETAALNDRVMDGFKVAEVHTDDKAH